jgi:hypothetical protein
MSKARLSKQPINANKNKTTTKKTAGGMAQVIECLLSKCKALSSTTSTGRKKKKYRLNTHLLGAGGLYL